MRLVGTWLLLAVGLVLPALYGGGCLTFCCLLLNNSLQDNGKWVSTKQGLEMEVMGWSSFMKTSQALAGCRLNLDAWHGYQEVLTAAKMYGFVKAEFDFRLSPGAYFALILDKGPERFLGIRISANGALKSQYFVARNDGEFLETRDLAVPHILPNQWNHCLFEVANNKGSIVVNGTRVDVGPISLAPATTPGFRGCEKPVAIDNVVFRRDDCIILEDRFLDVKDVRRYFAIAVVAMAAINVFYFAAHRAHDLGLTRILQSAVSFNWLLAFGLSVVTPYLFVSLGFYPRTPGLARAEADYLSGHVERRLEDIRQDGEDCAEQGRDMILFIGSSQTYGSGAHEKSETFVSRIQQRFDERAGGKSRYECINAGLLGSTIDYLVQLYEQKWIEMGPKAVVVILGCNDMGMADLEHQYPANLKKLVALNKQRGIRTLFVLEALSWERQSDHELTTHTLMRIAGYEEGVPVIDVHGRLLRSMRKGYLWWDFVHPTSFGHRLIGDMIFDELDKRLPVGR